MPKPDPYIPSSSRDRDIAELRRKQNWVSGAEAHALEMQVAVLHAEKNFEKAQTELAGMSFPDKERAEVLEKRARYARDDLEKAKEELARTQTSNAPVRRPRGIKLSGWD